MEKIDWKIEWEEYITLKRKVRDCREEFFHWHSAASRAGKHEAADRYLDLSDSMGRLLMKLAESFLNNEEG